MGAAFCQWGQTGQREQEQPCQGHLAVQTDDVCLGLHSEGYSANCFSCSHKSIDQFKFLFFDKNVILCTYNSIWFDLSVVIWRAILWCDTIPFNMMGYDKIWCMIFRHDMIWQHDHVCTLLFHCTPCECMCITPLMLFQTVIAVTAKSFAHFEGPHSHKMPQIPFVTCETLCAQADFTIW